MSCSFGGLKLRGLHQFRLSNFCLSTFLHKNFFVMTQTQYCLLLVERHLFQKFHGVSKDQRASWLWKLLNSFLCFSYHALCCVVDIIHVDCVLKCKEGFSSILLHCSSHAVRVLKQHVEFISHVKTEGVDVFIHAIRVLIQHVEFISHVKTEGICAPNVKKSPLFFSLKV